MSGNIALGMGLLKKDKDLAFLYSTLLINLGMAIQNQHFCINSDGYCENYD